MDRPSYVLPSRRLGMLTPSSNTVLEPVTERLLTSCPEVTAHFARFRVTRISLDDKDLGQFAFEPMLEASRLLADAKVDAITWNGTSASWLGVEHDQELVSRIEAETGITATTCVLSTLAALRSLKARRIALVTPYTSDVQQKIAANFAREGFECIAEAHFGIADNFSFGTVLEERIAEGLASVSEAQPDAILILCTNLAGAFAGAEHERRTGIPVLDSVVVTLWGALAAIGQPLETLAPVSPALARITPQSAELA